MNISELTNHIESSELSDATKQKISALLQGQTEVTAELEASVRDIIQAEIDADFAELGITNDDPEIQALDAELAANLESVQKELDEDMAYVDRELNELDSMRKQVTQIEEQQQVMDLQNQLSQGN
jgi:hypothetical protein